MKKSFTIIIILLVIARISLAQSDYLKNGRHNLSIAKDDTSRVQAIAKTPSDKASSRLDAPGKKACG